MITVDTESRTTEADHLSIRLWLRIVACTKRVGNRVSSELRGRGTTLARFDFLAQLERVPDGLRMTDLSRQMMVTAGNITRLADQLLAEGLISREPAADDRRASIVRLTPLGCAAFAEIAAQHEVWITEMFAGLDESERRTIFALLGKLKERMTAADGESLP
jgi:DNA-binding MarR family transcriptional regulator